MAQKITHLLLVALILSLGFGQLLRFDLLGLPIYLHDVLVILILALQGLTLKDEPNPAFGGEGQTLKLFFIGLSLGWVSALLHYPLAHLLLPSLYTLRLLAYLALYFILLRRKLSLDHRYFVISGLSCAVIGLLQYFLLPDMRIFQYLGWDDHLFRLTLPHFDPTFSAVMLGLFALTLNRSKWFIGLMVIWSILLTYSRSTWLSLSLTFALFMRPKKYLFFLVPILLVAILLLPRRFGEGTNLLRTYSLYSRLDADLSYLQTYNWDLALGRGLNTLVLDSPPSPFDNHATGPNNSYLYLLATTGVLGLLGWGGFMFSLYRRSPYRPMLIFFFVAALFNNVMFYPFTLLWVLLIESTAPSGA